RRSSDLTVTGNLVSSKLDIGRNPDKKQVSFRLATSNRYRDSAGVWQTEPAVYFNVQVKGALAENFLASNPTTKQTFTVVGTFRAREYTTKTGERRTTTFIQASDVSLSLRRTAQHLNEPFDTSAQDGPTTNDPSPW